MIILMLFWGRSVGLFCFPTTMDSIGKMIIAAGVAAVGAGVAVLSASYFSKYWDETRRTLLGKRL
jgi:hypothetical protein